MHLHWDLSQKSPEGNVFLHACLSNNIVLSFMGIGTSVQIVEINRERTLWEWLIGLLWSVNHLVTLGVTHAFFSRMGHHILVTCFSMTGGSVIVSRFYFPVTEFPHLLATRIRERGASFWRRDPRETGSRVARPIIILCWYLDVPSKEANS